MFRRRSRAQHPSSPLYNANDWNPNQVRNALFAILGKRLGDDNGRVLREDFDKHIAADPVHGVEQGYVCLLGKLIEYTDALGAPAPHSAEIAGVNAFSVFRKER